MLIGMDKLTPEQQEMDNTVLQTIAEYIVDIMTGETLCDDISILPDMIREYRKLRKELF